MGDEEIDVVQLPSFSNSFFRSKLTALTFDHLFVAMSVGSSGTRHSVGISKDCIKDSS